MYSKENEKATLNHTIQLIRFLFNEIETSTQLSFAFWVGAWTIFDKTDAEYKKKERKKHQKCQSDLDLSPNE